MYKEGCIFDQFSEEEREQVKEAISETTGVPAEDITEEIAYDFTMNFLVRFMDRRQMEKAKKVARASLPSFKTKRIGKPIKKGKPVK